MGDRSNFGVGSLYGGISFSDQAAKDAAEAPKEDSRKNWSAALAFAPPPRRPPPSKLKPPRTSAALYFNPTPGVASSSNPTDAVRQADPVVRLPPTASSSYSSAPTALTTSYSPPSPSTNLPPPPSRPNPSSAASQSSIRVLPSMTIEDDVNGFKKRPAGGAGGGSGGGRYGNNGGKKRKKQGPVGPAFDPHEMYDPSRPNDVLEYKRWREEEKKRKERARREKREKAAQAAKQGGGGGGGARSESDEGSYYSEDERDEQVSRGLGAHPPPKSYGESSSNPYPVFTSSSAPPPPPPSALAVPRAETGEEAYLRRAGISSAAPPSFAPPSFAPSSSSSSTPLNPESQPFIPAAPALPPTFVPLDADAIKKKLEAGRLAAAAIAAKFAKPPSFGGPIPPMAGAKEKEVDEDGVEKVKDERDFATRMMDKWGHKEGEGLGVDASGIKEALQVTKTAVAKQARRDFDEEGGGSSTSKPTRGMGAMGKIVSSETTARKQAEDRERFGEPSKVILLEQMVGSPDEVDDGLSEDVGEECGKHGVVTRVLLHTVDPPPADPALAIRIFVVFSGPAGAWTAIRALDGRYFGGRTVKARYFDERRFENGDRDD